MGNKKTTGQFIEKSIAKFGPDKYNYDAVVYKDSKTPVKLWCNEHKCYFYQTPKVHFKSKDCPKNGKRYKMTTETFIAKANVVHGVGRYDYSKVHYINNKTKVLIRCNVCGSETWQNPGNHLKGATCRQCAYIKAGLKGRITKEEFISRAIAVHGEGKYDYSKVKLTGMHDRVLIKCNVCGTWFKQIACNHLNGATCKQCAVKKRSQAQIKSLSEFVRDARKIHGDAYSYEKVVCNGFKKPIKIYCKKCKKYFHQAMGDHLAGKGCPSCASSKGEKNISLLLKRNNIIFQQQKKFIGCKNKTYLLFDFYLPDYNIAVEYDGEQHYKSIEFFGGDSTLKETQYRDNIKTNYCYENDIILCRIKYNQDIYKELSKYIELKETNNG